MSPIITLIDLLPNQWAVFPVHRGDPDQFTATDTPVHVVRTRTCDTHVRGNVGSLAASDGVICCFQLITWEEGRIAQAFDKKMPVAEKNWSPT